MDVWAPFLKSVGKEEREGEREWMNKIRIRKADVVEVGGQQENLCLLSKSAWIWGGHRAQRQVHTQWVEGTGTWADMLFRKYFTWMPCAWMTTGATTIPWSLYLFGVLLKCVCVYVCVCACVCVCLTWGKLSSRLSSHKFIFMWILQGITLSSLILNLFSLW